MQTLCFVAAIKRERESEWVRCETQRVSWGLKRTLGFLCLIRERVLCSRGYKHNNNVKSYPHPCSGSTRMWVVRRAGGRSKCWARLIVFKSQNGRTYFSFFILHRHHLNHHHWSHCCCYFFCCCLDGWMVPCLIRSKKSSPYVYKA